MDNKIGLEEHLDALHTWTRIPLSVDYQTFILSGGFAWCNQNAGKWMCLSNKEIAFEHGEDAMTFRLALGL